MSEATAVRKITVSLPRDLVAFADREAERPALVIQNDVGNRFSPTTVVAAITRTLPPRPYPFVVVIEPAESGLPERSAVNCSRPATIQQSGAASRLRPPRGETVVRAIGRLSRDKLAEVDAALRFNLALR